MPMLWMEIAHCWESPVLTVLLDVGDVPFSELREERSLALAEIVDVKLAQPERPASVLDQLWRRPCVALLAPHIGIQDRRPLRPL